MLNDDQQPEILFRKAYEAAFGVYPVFSVDYLSNAELLERTENLKAAILIFFR